LAEGVLPGRGDGSGWSAGCDGLEAGDRGSDLPGPGPTGGKAEPQAAAAADGALGAGEESRHATCVSRVPDRRAPLTWPALRLPRPAPRPPACRAKRPPRCSSLACAQLLDRDRQIKSTGKLINSRFWAHPQAEIIESLPGLGPILCAEFIVATGGNLPALPPPGATRIGAAGMPTRPVEAKPALDDLEPWAAGSFDEIVLACDLDILTDKDYAALFEAITP
jgi:hypothetical protein